jgi:hypothetical protein
MATANDIITAAFIKVGIDNPTAPQIANALISLNNMVSFFWADTLPPVITRESFTVVKNDPEYTVGDGGQWDTPRPMDVKSCYLRDSKNYDYPLNIMSGQDYARMSNKTWTARPTELYFVPEYPYAKIIFNYSPDASYTAYLDFLKNFTEFAATTTDVDLPNEYKEAFVYNLAVSLGEDWDRVVSKTVFIQAQKTRDVIERLNASTRQIPKARFDIGYMGSNKDSDLSGGYNIVSDELIDGGAF